MRELPTGTLTFLFTDIVETISLWEESPDAMSAALRRHDLLLTDAIERKCGRVVKSAGDGVFAVFPTTTNAIAAAVEIHHALAAEVWPTPRPICVRIAINTGEARFEYDDYYGVTVNRSARLLALARGQQTLLSEATATLVRETLPSGASLVDLGEQPLRGLRVPEHVFELVTSDPQ